MLDRLDTEVRAWTDAAALGETPWICADCGASFQEGMPDECAYGHQPCTDTITRDKARVAAFRAKFPELQKIINAHIGEQPK